MSTFPSATSVAVWPCRGVIRFPVAVKVLLVASYNSAVGRHSKLSVPPATSTIRFGRSVAECPERAAAMLPVGDNPDFVGSTTLKLRLLDSAKGVSSAKYHF